MKNMQEIQTSTDTKVQHSIPYMTCKSKNQGQIFCCSSKCKCPAVICRNSHCQCLSLFHPHCEMISIQSIIQRIAKKKQEQYNSSEIDKAMLQVYKMYDHAIQQLVEDRESLKNWREKYQEMIDSDQGIFMDLIINNKDQQITGTLVNRVKKNLQEQEGSIVWLSQSWVKQYWKKEQQKLKKIFMQLKAVTKTLERQPYQFIPQIDSNILQNSEKLIGFFDKSISELKLLYRASENDFSTDKFHDNCDNITQTITLLKTEDQKIIGGYTPFSWKSSSSPSNVENQSSIDYLCQSFIFTITNDEKYMLVDPSTPIRNSRQSGPIFGREDIYISNYANENYKSHCYFPISYQNQNQDKQRNEQVSEQFCGNQKGYFKIIQWQVFKINWFQ